jgi:hypothetical protein
MLLEELVLSLPKGTHRVSEASAKPTLWVSISAGEKIVLALFTKILWAALSG